MRKNLVVGILKETKKYEYRAPLVPGDVKWLIKRGISVEVERSPERIFSDREYKINGAKILNKVKDADLLVGIKEPRVVDLCIEKIYMVFSHTIKGQFKNMPLLKNCLKKNITLIDYEKIVDVYGKRLIYFGKFAGICGIIDSLHYLGKKLEHDGFTNPLSLIKPSCKYPSLKKAKQDMYKVYCKIKRHGFSKELSPFIIGITGHGNVSKGVQEILRLLGPTEIHPKDMLRFVSHQKKRCHKLYKIVFLREEKLRAKNNKGFYFEEYLKKPQKFESNIDKYLPYLNMLVHTSYWDSRFPRMVTRKMIHKLAKDGPFRLKFIADLSCDVNGSIELTYKTTTPNKPTFTYNLKNKRFADGYESKGITVLAIDNLPAELPRDASFEFSRLIREYVYQVAAHGAVDVARHAAIPLEVRHAVIAQNGELTKNFTYLKQRLCSVE